MVTGNNDPVESFFNSLNVVKHAFTPLELGLRKAAKDFECCWSGGGGNKRNWVIEGGDDGGGGGDGGKLAMHSSGGGAGDKMQMFAVKKRSGGGGGQFIVGDGGDKKKGLSIRVPVKAFLGFFSLDCTQKNNSSKRGEIHKDHDHDGNVDCKNCLQHVMAWPLIVDKFVQGFPMPFKAGKKRFQKMDDHDADKRYMHTFGSVAELRVSGELQGNGVKGDEYNNGMVLKHEKTVSLECLLSCIFDQLVHNIQKLDQRNVRESKGNSVISSFPPHDRMKAVTDMLEGKKADVNGFLRNFMFARVGGVPSSIVGVTDSVKEESEDKSNPPVVIAEEPVATPPQKLGSGLLDIPLSNVERLRSSLSTVTLTELIELVPQLGRATQDYPDKKKLISVQDFFRYTESEGRRFFEELDRDGDGQVTLEDLEDAIRRRKLPKRYARDLMRRTRSHLFSKSFGWKQFLSLMEQKEATILRAYTSLCLSRSGTLQKNQIMASLKNAGLPANEENAVAMMRFLNADTEECISYGHFRNFMVLLPSERLQDDPRNIWFESATVVAVAPSMEIRAGSVLRSALAGGLACALSTSLMYPIDTIKTRVQASSLSFPEIISKIPEMGARGLYRGSVPAILGQFSSHGLRTGIFEASKLVLINVAPNLPEIQVQSLASFCSTSLGTAVRIPCEVLKQRCQAGLFNNVGEAIVGTWNQDGPKGFFRGTGATLCREVPFYVAGMGLYAESKKAWETIMVGAISGGVAAVVTTPFDVMKTRMMTAPGGRTLSMSLVAFSILRKEGPLGLFKGALPRFFWIAPLGAMNFAGYELARKAMNKNVEPAA